VNFLTAFTRHRLVVVLCVLVGTGAGVAAGLARKSVYSATAVANAGSLNIFAQAVPGFVQAAQTLATTYSRLGTSDAVLGSVSRASGLPISTVASRVYLVPVADSSVMDITGEGPTASAATRLANEEFDALAAYITRLAEASQVGNMYLGQIQALNTQLTKLSDQATVLRNRLGAAAAVNASPQLATLNTRIATLRVHLQGVENLYESALQDATGSDTLALISRPTSASSDRTSGFERYIVAAEVGALLVALLIGLILEDRRTKLAVRLKSMSVASGSHSAPEVESPMVRRASRSTETDSS
jgi:capsular polysaccharide biosynthesis protein